MIAHIHSAANVDFEGKAIEVECDTSNGLPNLLIVGLGNKAIEEAKERVRSAIRNSGLEFPRKRITINLAPANLPKDGAHFDLPIAIALLCVSRQFSQLEFAQRTMLIGELGLDGSLKPVRGIIGHVQTAVRIGMKQIIIPIQNVSHARLIKGIEVIGAASLREVYLHLQGEKVISSNDSSYSAAKKPTVLGTTFDDIHGQAQAKRALLIAAAGHHNILLSGPPGAGKTMLAKALVSILPPLTIDEIIEVTKLHNLAGQIDEEIIAHRPFRSPHHSASLVSLIGGGAKSRPGEISLAHRGVLFLDELPEYRREAIEALRQPLEDKQIHIARANSRVSYPADFMLVATQNPCPCGFANDDKHVCNCSASQIHNYQKKISGPLLDRIDLIVEVSRVEYKKLLSETSQHTSFLDQVQLIRDCQVKRYGSTVKTNGNASNFDIKLSARLSSDAKKLLDNASSKLSLSARSYFKIIKVSRTIADLEDSNDITTAHISEALQYRRREYR